MASVSAMLPGMGHGGWAVRTAAITALGLVLSACTSGAKDAAPPPASPGVNASASPGAHGDERDIGAGVSVPREVAPGMRAVVSGRANPYPKLALGSPVFEVSTTAQPAKATTVTLPLRSALTPGQVTVVITSSTIGGPWQSLPTTVSTDGRHVTASATHFSWFTTLLVPVNDMLDIARNIVDSSLSKLTLTAKTPKCENEASAAAKWKTVQRGSDPLLWCIGVEGGQTVVRMVSNRHYPLVLTHPGAVKASGGADDITSAATWAAKLYSQRTMLMTGDEVTYQINDSVDAAKVTSEADGLAQGVYSLQIGLETLLSIVTRFGLVGGPDTSVPAMISKAIAVPRCAAALQHPSDVGRIFSLCLDAKLLATAFGPWGALTAVVLAVAPLVEYFRGTVSGVADLIRGRDITTVTITRKDTGSGTVGFDHWGPVKLGMTPSQAARILGTRVASHGESGTDGCFQPQLARPNDTVWFMVEAATWDGPIERFEIGYMPSRSAASGGPRTEAGVGIGSSEAQVKAAYPGRVKVGRHVYVLKGHYLEVLAGPGDPAGTAIVFETNQTGRVTAMRWGYRRPAEYIEGCL